MRTTITIADDVFAEIERLRRLEGIGPSEALNRLARRGISVAESEQPRYVHTSHPLGLKVDVSDVGAVLDLLDDHDSPAA
ncbi:MULTISPECIES: CopG family transcriptional regulator [unclassified Pseudactinotalea]|uniref:CopG family transcriptional regulator n=1 Tax=unclassified Pseudactinotalea TaxID=2649176 RepID=UPI00128E75C5|nr:MULTISPECIES: CopG family transcriptional regulator [unclassified Pseudactinotalea]MPV51365.1 CopG family transcriptional regulator [Pseudactinotalea sp. HY160]QGH70791.1 CopG family transcriptional regulator [Pseudactinotalea sp. HY158]